MDQRVVHIVTSHEGESLTNDFQSHFLRWLIQLSWQVRCFMGTHGKDAHEVYKVEAYSFSLFPTNTKITKQWNYR